MRKILAILLMLVCFSSLTACKEGTLNNVNTDSNNTTNQEQEELKQIPIQSFDGHWKECNLPEEKDITASQWFDIIIKNNQIQIRWLSYYDQFRDDYEQFYNVSKSFHIGTIVWGHNDDHATWENPAVEITEYSFVSIEDGGYYIDSDGVRVDNEDFRLLFTYKDGKLSISRRDLGDPYMNRRDTDTIYFEKISD